MFRSLEVYVAAHLPEGKCAVAVSGGGDSVALLLLLVEVGLKPLVLHYNHNIRKESADELVFVEKLANSLGCSFAADIWDSPALGGNTQQAARQARYSFFEKSLKTDAIEHLFVAHTEDDLMETCFLRLSKGSGIAGLPGLKATSKRDFYTLHRPLLDVTREELRNYLTEKGQNWCDDPTNENIDYWRPRYRQAKKVFESLGLTATSLNGFFKSAERVNDYFDFELNKFSQKHIIEGDSQILISLQHLSDLHIEMRWRLYNKIAQSLFGVSALRGKTKQQLDLIIQDGGKISIANGFAEIKDNSLRFFI